MRVTAYTSLAIVVLAGTMSPRMAAAAPPIFHFESDEFWLNLHKFLYVLGEAQTRSPNASRAAVAGAPADAERGVAALDDRERRAWADAVGFYAGGLSRRSPITDGDLATLEQRLANAADAATLERSEIDPSLRSVLERVAPVYRHAWWTAHRARNREWVAAITALVDAKGASVLDFITRAYGVGWPADGYRVHVVPYALWAGAYSTSGNLLVVSSNAGAPTRGWPGLETVFHESMHQWDDAIARVLDEAGRTAGRQLPRNLSHAIVFYTAGEAVRRVAPPGYVPQAQSEGVWGRGLTAIHAGLVEFWQPYLDGDGTRDAALAALVQRTGVPPPIFTFQTDDFWLNLHQFLYAVGRAEAKLPDATQPALATAAPDMAAGIQRLTDEQRRTWMEVVTAYAHTWSLKDPVADAATGAIVAELARIGAAPSLGDAKIDATLRDALTRAAPLYTRAWWPAHRDANRAWRMRSEALLSQHGAAVRDYITHAYALEWPANGRLVHVTRYTNFGGAFSLARSGVILEASADPAQQGLAALEGIFHEAMHQWDPQVFGFLGAQARTLNVQVPPDLPHAIIFFTAGEAVRQVQSAYVPLVEQLGIWKLRLLGSTLAAERLKGPLVDTWKPYLDGRGTRDEALRALLARVTAPR